MIVGDNMPVFVPYKPRARPLWHLKHIQCERILATQQNKDRAKINTQNETIKKEEIGNIDIPDGEISDINNRRSVFLEEADGGELVRLQPPGGGGNKCGGLAGVGEEEGQGQGGGSAEDEEGVDGGRGGRPGDVSGGGRRRDRERGSEEERAIRGAIEG